jgi:acetylornithine deacetylase
VQAGNWPSSVPETLVVEGRAGLVPGETLDETKRALEAAIASAATRDPWLQDHPPRIEYFSGQFAAAEVDVSHPLVHAVASAHLAATETDLLFDAATYGADMRHFVNSGQIPCIMYGPGDVRRAHRPDEFVPVDELMTAATTLALTMIDWCGADY